MSSPRQTNCPWTGNAYQEPHSGKSLHPSKARRHSPDPKAPVQSRSASDPRVAAKKPRYILRFVETTGRLLTDIITVTIRTNSPCKFDQCFEKRYQKIP